jgi:transcriptional regulator with XRE-family HTH domain
LSILSSTGMARIDDDQQRRHDARVTPEAKPGAETVGARLRRLRIEQGASQRDLSVPGITYAYISRIEAGARTPSVKALRMLAKKLGVTPEYLETGSELDASETRELRIAEQELRLRLEGEADVDAVRELLGDAEAYADVAASTRARIVLGLEAAARGEHAATIEHLSEVIGSELVTAASRPDVYSTLGRAYAAIGMPRQSVALFDRALAELGPAEPGNVHARIRYSTYLSYALTDLGELQRAKAVVGELFADAGQTVDRYTRVRLLWSLGRLSLEQAKPLAALDSFRRAVALLEATEDTLHLARAHIACADATISAGDDLGGALHHLDEAERLLGPSPGVEDLAVIRRMQAMCATAAGDSAGAEHLGSQALLLAAELPNERGNAWWAIAAARAAGGGGDADDAYREAVELLAEHGTVRQYSAVLRSYGRYLREAGREHEALDVFERAAEVASNLQGEPATAER